ncbi:MAG: hypothetical protein NVS1B4_03900 [Gemmatimonadaceae bacterium]
MTIRSDPDTAWSRDSLSPRASAEPLATTALPASVVEAIGRALGASRPAESAELQPIVADLVARLKARGLAPERVIVLLKEGVRSAAAACPADAPTPPREAIDRRDALMRNVVTWCITEYFRDA